MLTIICCLFVKLSGFQVTSLVRFRLIYDSFIRFLISQLIQLNMVWSGIYVRFEIVQ